MAFDPQPWLNFATPMAVIIAAILQRLQSDRIARKADEIAVKADTAAQKTDTLNGKVDQVHQLTNDRMSKMVAKVAELQDIINQNTATNLDSKMEEIRKAINAVKDQRGETK